MLLVAIADAVERLDLVEFIIAGAELLADALDVAVDRPVVHVDVLAIGRVDKLVAALYHARPRRQRLHQQELGDGELDVLALPDTLVLGLVQHQIAAHHHPAGRRPEPSARPTSLRRSRARMRSISSRWLNGLVM